MLPTQDLTHRRRIVAHGLRGHLPDPVVRRAARLCDDAFGRDPSFSVVKFLDRLSAAEADAAAARPALFASLQKARLLPAEQLAPDPLGDPAAAPAARPEPPATAFLQKSAVSGGGWDGVFNALLAGLTAALGRQNPGLPGKALKHLAFVSGDLGLSPTAAAELTAWVQTGTPRFTARTGRLEMHHIAHDLYRWACEEFGPVATDRLFSAAVKMAESHPSAALCPPQAIL